MEQCQRAFLNVHAKISKILFTDTLMCQVNCYLEYNLMSTFLHESILLAYVLINIELSD